MEETIQGDRRVIQDEKRPPVGRLLDFVSGDIKNVEPNTLSGDHRRQLEKTVVKARDIAEAGAKEALEALAVHHHEPYGHTTGEQRKLRNRLRAHARHLGDSVDARSGAHSIDHLIHECAYEHWHGMLFARFLAENQLLIEPEMGVPITLDECEDLAKESGIDEWVLAARFAHRMLPQVFRPDHPVFEVQLAREYRLNLEQLVEDLPTDIFQATDALGWVYQFWQVKKKAEVNKSEVKIGADELPAVTQLFTEPYMVQFLLHNSLGAWWVSRYPDKACPVNLSYLRRTEDGIPAAGVFEGWPDDLAEFRLLDPCCGSGHFLVAALLMLVPMRMALEGLNATEAVDVVLRENIHGLELDQRCVAIAAFALAFEAWRFPDAGGYRTLPKLNLAWCGQPVAGKKEQWIALGGGDSRLEAGMSILYDTFRDAPILGSLIDPARSISGDILTAGFDELKPLLDRALREHTGEENWEEAVITALGLTDVYRILNSQYHLVLTNVPYLARGKQNERLRKFSETRYSMAKGDLANVFLDRCLEFSMDRGVGVTQIVMPQNWLFLITYKAQRKRLLRENRWDMLARLGYNAFETIGGEVVNVILLTLTRIQPNTEYRMCGIDVSERRTGTEKAELVRGVEFVLVNQKNLIDNPDARVALAELTEHDLLECSANAVQGLTTGDNARFVQKHWEQYDFRNDWIYLQSVSNGNAVDYGAHSILYWQKGEGELLRILGDGVKGRSIWGRRGVTVGQMHSLSTAIYLGYPFDMSCAAIVPVMENDLLPVVAFVTSGDFPALVRQIDQKLNVTTATLGKVSFDIEKWRRASAEMFPEGFPKPYSDDPTQWIFHGHPCGSVFWNEKSNWTSYGQLRKDASVLHIVVARLLGYRWPSESDPSMELASEQRAWAEATKKLHSFEDEEGVVCIPSIHGERPAFERLLHLLKMAYGVDWHDGILTSLLMESGGISLDDWLRNKFFGEHCKLFHRRPFIWHVWDGRKRDGFHALVNYHKLVEGEGKGRRLLESLTYSYLGDWISRRQDDVKRGESGAEDRLVAALELQKCLVAILEGEPPFDIFVRWKPIQKQSIGWEPDINDGVRLNIRPFMAKDLPGGKKDAGILRTKPKIHWRKDRGKENVRDKNQFPWFWKDGKFTGERVNDLHLTNAEKRDAREKAGGKKHDK